MFQLCVALACLFLAGPTGVQPQSDAVTLDMLKQTKAIEAYITGQYKFRETNSAGGSYDSFDSFASFGVGNVNTAKNPKNTVPSWDGFNFSIVLAQSIRDGETENMTMSGNFSPDLSNIEKIYPFPVQGR